MSVTPISRIVVIASVRNRTQGHLQVGFSRFACAIGRSGVIVSKREGDGGTPSARLALRRLFLRPDKGPHPRCMLPRRWIASDSAWCDDPQDRRYNRLIRRPPGEAEERLWRSDHLYDVIVELGWNDRPVRRGRGSAIFWHLARPGFSPTAGCVATERATFRKVLLRLTRNAILITPGVARRRL